ncbi:proline--tRNA ligase, partial [Candidatus Dojkabacteria bacterium]|nr:proline--tRNA ligase [Candidatus Dojkabacteria bacterium]
IINCKNLDLADEETVKRVTKAEVGYAGLIGLPGDLEIFVDDSLEGLSNFECGANETNIHLVNVNWERDLELPTRFYDLKTAKEGDLHPETQEIYEVYKASEVGNIFPLNTKYSEDFNYKYTNENGEEKYVYMGSYGIGTTRLMGVVVEVFGSKNEIKWPKNIAPYQLHLIGLNLEDSEVQNNAEDVYEHLKKAGIEVLFDDRIETRAGEKFADAELIGCPLRAVVSKKSAGLIELKEVGKDESRLINLDQLIEEAKTFFISAK